MTKTHWALILVVIVGAMALMPEGPEPDRCDIYHDMRQVWKDSNGEWGWPKGAMRGCE